MRPPWGLSVAHELVTRWPSAAYAGRLGEGERLGLAPRWYPRKREMSLPHSLVRVA